MSNASGSHLMRVTDNVIGRHGFRRMKEGGMDGVTLFNQIFASLLHNEMHKWTWPVIGELVDGISRRTDYCATGTALSEYVTYENDPSMYMKKIGIFHVTAFIHWRLNTPGS